MDAEFDFNALDPANLMMQAVPNGGAAAPAQDPVDDPAPAGDAIDALIARQTAQPAPVDTPPTADNPPVDSPPAARQPEKPEGVNMRKLRELREVAERERDQFKLEREELAAKLAELEPRAKGYETEREQLRQQLEEKEQAHAEAQAMAWRVDARTKPEWQEKAQAIRNAAESVNAILALPAVREAGITHGALTLLDPSARAALNDTIRALNDSGHFAEAQDLIDSHRAVNAWRGELRKIEEGAAVEAQAWQTRQEETAASVVRSVRDGMAQANPIHSSRSPEFLALPKEQQDYLTAQHAAAEEAARASLARLNRPEAVVAETYRTQLQLRLYHQANGGLVSQLTAAQKEVADLKSRLAGYEKAAGGGSPSGGAAPRVSSIDDPAEAAKMLDPRNMPGYRGAV